MNYSSTFFITLSLFSAIFLSSCKSKVQELDSNNVKSRYKVYIIDKKDYPFIEKNHPDSTFTIDSSRVTISISYECKGNYDVLDTPWCDKDTCHIDAYQNVYVHIKIKSLTEKEIIISKELLTQFLRNMNNKRDYQLSYTSIYSIVIDKKQIVFRSFLALLPNKDDGGGLFVNYLLPIQGGEKSIKFIRMDTAAVEAN